METETNRREYPEDFFRRRHVKLNDLIHEIRPLPHNERIRKYLAKNNIPKSPEPEFHVFHLKHDTDEEGLRGIWADNGFKIPENKQPSDGSPPLLWWSLSVGPDDIMSAEKRLLESTFPDRTEEQAQMQQSFLEKFTTSPAFKKTSRLGSYRFIFPLEEVLEAYREQFCGDAQPVVRVFKTVLYRQEVMYVVLVHSPANQELFTEYPLLNGNPADPGDPDDPDDSGDPGDSGDSGDSDDPGDPDDPDDPDDQDAVCSYNDGYFTWRPQAMSETHKYKLVLRREEQQMEARAVRWPQFYVWDHVAVALHVDEKVLNFDPSRLRENLKFCEAEKEGLVRGVVFQKFKQAEKIVTKLWPDSNSALERA